MKYPFYTRKDVTDFEKWVGYPGFIVDENCNWIPVFEDAHIFWTSELIFHLYDSAICPSCREPMLNIFDFCECNWNGSNIAMVAVSRVARTPYEVPKIVSFIGFDDEDFAIVEPIYNKAMRRVIYDNRRRQAREERGNPVFRISFSQLNNLKEIQNSSCYFCGYDIRDDFEKDHLTPVSKGGKSDLMNLALLCRSCNRSKSSKTETEFWRLISGYSWVDPIASTAAKSNARNVSRWKRTQQKNSEP